MNYLVTGAAGFIGMHVCARLLAQGHVVVGVDNLNDYYDVALKQARLDQLSGNARFRRVDMDIAAREAFPALVAEVGSDCVIHLAAQAGVRYSLTHPHAYADSNLLGFVNVLEACRQQGVAHLIYASSSSVYGGNAKLPYAEQDSVDHPVSLYAATKKANELMAHAYSHLYQLPTTGLRFFTVYGPWGRPDMSPMLFARAILAGEPIKVFNHGRMLRDFTYIDDIVEGVLRIAEMPPAADPDFDQSHPDPAHSWAPYRVLNIGNQQPVPLLDFIAALEDALGVPAIKEMLPMQPGDVVATHADTSALAALTGFDPDTPLREGVTRFVAWYRDYYRM